MSEHDGKRHKTTSGSRVGIAGGTTPETSVLTLRRMRIDTYQQPVVYMHRDCPVCRSEGFEAQSRIQIRHRKHSIIATLNVVDGELLSPEEAGLSEAAWRRLGADEGERVTLTHPPTLDSLSRVRGKVYGQTLTAADMQAIVRDVTAGYYSDIHLSAFITACAGDRLELQETIDLTRAMIDVGERLEWPAGPIVDKHSVGGLPGNRTTPIVVSIAAAHGLTMPKTSSRAITSPAGTADVMETMTNVALDVAAIRRVVERENGCLVWGGAVRLSPADDILIRVQRPLDLDSEGQLVASVLSKKAAAGSTHVVIDIPVGPTTKVRSDAAARILAERLVAVGRALDLTVLVGDIISTARTMIETVEHLRKAALSSPVCIGVHAVFAGSAYSDLLAAGAARIVTCNTIPHASNGIDVSPLIAEAARSLMSE